mmetsp:Transcript_35977/g.56263  ORF Transcript_35977/g.56263 Transcript_35977/m.56263 type:complete len:210 (+) Transcript_35977:293-922(+)
MGDECRSYPKKDSSTKKKKKRQKPGNSATQKRDSRSSVPYTIGSLRFLLSLVSGVVLLPQSWEIDDLSNSNRLPLISEGESSKLWVIGIQLNTYIVGNLETNVGNSSILQELGVANLPLSLLVGLRKQPTNFTLHDLGMKMENTLESLGEHRLQIHQNQLGIEHTHTLAGVINGTDDVSSEEILELNVLETNTEIFTTSSLAGFLLPHL